MYDRVKEKQWSTNQTVTNFYKCNVHNTAMDSVISNLEQRSTKYVEICSDLSCLGPRQFSKTLPKHVLYKISKLGTWF